MIFSGGHAKGNEEVLNEIGELRPDGPCLLMENEVGDLDVVGTERLYSALKRAQQMPHLVVLASCETADDHDDLPSMAAGLVQHGVPAVVGWVRPVADVDATQAAKEGPTSHLLQHAALGRVHRSCGSPTAPPPTRAWSPTWQRARPAATPPT